MSFSLDFLEVPGLQLYIKASCFCTQSLLGFPDMVRIGLNANDTPREFTAEESEEILPIWRKLTQKASDRSMEVVAYYGKVEPTDPEWTFLKSKINDNLQDWATKVRRLGGIPRELWTITWIEEGDQRVWRLDADTEKSLR